jgi:hypothetical protein
MSQPAFDSGRPRAAATSSSARPRPLTPAAPAQGAAKKVPVSPATGRKPGKQRPLLVLLAVLTGINLAGLPYYLLSTAQRARSPLHPWFKPSGIIGQSAGVASFLLFMFLWLYPLRKKFRWLAFTGALSKWLDVHVVAGLCLPLLGAVNAAWRFTGFIGLGYGAMLIVAFSGIVGKYLYVRIPRSRSGVEMSLEEIETERKVLLRYVAGESGMSVEEVDAILAPNPEPYQGLGILGTLRRMASDDFDRWRAGRRLGRGWKKAARGRVDRRVLRLVRRIARRQMALSQQARLLDATHRLFRYWHVAHRPVAVTALVAVTVHVGVAVAMGVTWFY